jgi:putative methionine-R-sulfoxide reductase with GAF domain
MRSLHDIEPCFQGVIPSYIGTCSADGEPNVTAVSIVHLLSPSRVGVSCQFMNKTLRNLRETRRAQITVMSPITLAEYRLDLRFERLLESGASFDKMAATLEGIASQSGMTDVFALTGVAELEVLSWRKATPEGAEESATTQAAPDPIARLERISAAMEAATDLDALFDQTFAALNEQLGLQHGFLLLADGANERLYTVASHGFEQARFGAEIAIGEGMYGIAAARRTSMRTGSMRRERIMAQAVARESAHTELVHLPLPGLANAESSVAVPLVRADQCLGVLCFQSAEPGAFTDGCEKTLVIVARHLAAMISVLGAGAKEVELSAKRGPVGSRALVTRIKFFEADGSIFIDDQYLIKGVAGRILWRVLSNYANEQRDEFSSKEIRLDPDLGLPALKDNLEARLISLRKRLNERTADLRIEKTGRGRFRLEVSRELILERREGR